MLERKHNNEKIEAIGKKLVENDLLPISEIDRIVANPHLFELVSKRIAANERSAAVVSRSYRWMPAAAASLACVVVLAVFGSTVIRYMGEADDAPSMTFIQVPDAGPEVARPEIPPKGMFGKLSQGRATQSNSKRQKVAFSNKQPRAKNTPALAADPVKPRAEYYPVAYTGDPAETASGGRIIRVDLDRSSLFALGVNLPLENVEASVKADLLVGMDGVTRGIRLVE
jgi:hypothetical protein